MQAVAVTSSGRARATSVEFPNMPSESADCGSVCEYAHVAGFYGLKELGTRMQPLLLVGFMRRPKLRWSRNKGRSAAKRTFCLQFRTQVVHATLYRKIAFSNQHWVRSPKRASSRHVTVKLSRINAAASVHLPSTSPSRKAGAIGKVKFKFYKINTAS